jgi:hypothetical protein
MNSKYGQKGFELISSPKRMLKIPQNKMFYYQDRNIELCRWKEDNFMQRKLDKSVMLLGTF